MRRLRFRTSPHPWFGRHGLQMVQDPTLPVTHCEEESSSARRWLPTALVTEYLGKVLVAWRS